jgi:hypothetical protein
MSANHPSATEAKTEFDAALIGGCRPYSDRDFSRSRMIDEKLP